MTAWTCPEIEGQLDLLAAGECDTEVRRMVEDHLHACPACTAKYAESRKLMGLLTLHLDEAGPMRLRQRLEQLDRQNRRKNAVQWVNRAAALAAMLVICAGLLIMPSGPVPLGDALQLSLAVQPLVRGEIPGAAPDHEAAMKSMVFETRGPSTQMGESFRRELTLAQQQGRLPPLPELAVHLELTLKNTSRQPIELRLGDSTSELHIDVEGNGVVRLPAPGAPVPGFLQERTVRLEPGKADHMVVDRLIDGRPGALEYIYLTEPGTYTLTIQVKARAGGGEVHLTSPAVHLKVTNPP
jgi:hypothetical protein